MPGTADPSRDPRRRPGARRGGAGDRHERRRPGARLLAPLPARPVALRGERGLALRRQRGPPDPAPGSPGARPRRARRRDRGRRAGDLPRRRGRGGRSQPHVPGGAGGDACRDRTRRGRAPAALRDRHGALQPDPQRGGPRRAPPAHPPDGPPGRREPRDRPQDRRGATQPHAGLPRLQRRGPESLRPDGSLLHAPGGVRVGGRGPDRGCCRAPGAGEGSPHLDRRLAARPSQGPERAPADRGRGQPARSPGAAGRGAGDRPARDLHRASRRRPGSDRGAGRRRAAVLPRGAGPHDPGGDGALAPGRRLERGRDPGDGRGRADRPPGATP